MAGKAKSRVKLRAPRAGDYGRVVALHGELYAKEFGYDASFEALVAEIGASFLQDFDAKRSRSLATVGELRTTNTEPTTSPPTSAIQQRSRPGLKPRTKPATISATSASKLAS